jgi:hypothetical protein
MILDVLNQCINKWTSDVLDSALNPIIIMKKISLSCKNSKIYCKAVVFTVDDSKKTISDFLGDIKNPR